MPDAKSCTIIFYGFKLSNIYKNTFLTKVFYIWSNAYIKVKKIILTNIGV